jgi:hypothetical protein
VALGCSLPDSIKVGRTTPVVSGLAVRDLGVRETLACSERVSFLATLAVSETTGLGVGAASESDWEDLFVCEALGLFSRSAASAPAIRICSIVGSAEARFFSCDLGFVRAGASGSEGLSLAVGVAGLEACGFVSRVTITSCPYICPTRIKP